MKSTLLALMLTAFSATMWAGVLNPPGNQLPDAGASVLLLGIGVTVLGIARRAFRR